MRQLVASTVSVTGDRELTPLEYMLAVMRDETADPVRRDRMAIAAAVYCHERVSSPPLGKKARAAQQAATAGEGTEWGRDLDPWAFGRL